VRASLHRIGRALGLAALLAGAPAAAFDPGGRGPLPATGSVEVAFAPWDDTESLLLQTIRAARSEIYVQAYVFTSRKLARALIEAQRAGRSVVVLADREMTFRGRGSRIPELAAAGVQVLLEYRYPAAHNKVILIDPQQPKNAVVTGSYNFTYSAKTRNAENLLVLRDNPALARAYFANFQRHRDGALAYRDALPADWHGRREEGLPALRPADPGGGRPRAGQRN
jgi:phosphatidylserine/phosphatidylglycerophosphate/cardiolipin synthase-like enzyme